MTVSLLLSILASQEFTDPRLKLLFFLLVSLAGVFLFVVLGVLLSFTYLNQGYVTIAALRQVKWIAISGIVLMAYVGMWIRPK